MSTKTTSKKVETKKVDEKKDTKKTTPKVNTQKENKKVSLNITIQDVLGMYEKAGIKCYNPDAKGNYRIMGNKKGSSLNLHKADCIIFSTDADFENVVKAEIADVEATKGTNSQDKSRPNTVLVKTVEALEKVLKVYAMNSDNLVASK